MASSASPNREPIKQFDWTRSDEPSSAIVLALAEVVGVDPLEMDSLYHVVDSGSLNRLVTSTQNSPSQSACRVQFEYYDHRIVIHSNGSGYIYDQTHTPVESEPMSDAGD